MAAGVDVNGTVRWVLANDAARVICVERQLEEHIELRVMCGNLTLATSHCRTSADAERWLDLRRHAWQAYGWKPQE